MNARRWFWIVSVLVLVGCGASTEAQVVGVTLRLDTNQIFVGASTFLHVQARILPAFRTNDLQIFSWYVDVLNTNAAAANANYIAMTKAASDKDPSTSSNGTADGAHRRGIYDTFLNLPGAGRDTSVELMAIPIQGVAVGSTRLRLQAGTGVPSLMADFLVGGTNVVAPLIGGDYTAAVADLTVVPSPLVPPHLTITRGLLNGTNQVTLHYEVQGGFNYFVEWRDSLATNSLWQTLSGGPHNSGVPTDLPAGRTRFYRVRVEVP